MNRRQILTGAAGLLVAPVVFPMVASAEDDISKNLINKPEDGWVIYGPQTNKVVKDKAAQGGRAIEVKITSASGNMWEAAAQTAIIKPIKSGDKIMGAAWLRSVTENGARANLNLRLQINSAPYTELGQTSISVGPEWQLYPIEAVATKDYAANSTVMVIHLASAKQTIYLGPGFVLDLGQG